MPKQYHINTFYSEEDGCYIATFDEMPHVSGVGDTPQDAQQELHIAFQLQADVAKEDGKPLNPKASIDAIAIAAKLLNISELARAAGISPDTLRTKLNRGTALKAAESRAVKKALKEKGILLQA